MAIDLRPGTKDYNVPTSRNGYMGPDVVVTARNAAHAIEIVKQNGYTPNPYFPPEEK